MNMVRAPNCSKKIGISSCVPKVRRAVADAGRHAALAYRKAVGT
jgi:hypothetical protein